MNPILILRAILAYLDKRAAEAAAYDAHLAALAV